MHFRRRVSGFSSHIDQAWIGLTEKRRDKTYGKNAPIEDIVAAAKLPILRLRKSQEKSVDLIGISATKILERFHD